MMRFRVLIISILLFACSPQELFTTPAPNLTVAKFTPTSPPLTPTNTIIPTHQESTVLGVELPPDCSIYNPSINSGYYGDLSHGACNNPTLSPNRLQIAYASLKIAESGKIVQEARLYSVSLAQSLPIYESICGILYPEWATKDYLVISDFSQDMGCSQNVIYDIKKGQVIAALSGSVHRNWKSYWPEDKSAFFTLSPELFGPICSETLSGFDMQTIQPIPKIKPVTPNTNLYVVIGQPIWSKDNNTLLAVIRDGTCTDLEKYECTYSNSYIISINFNGDAPTITYLFYDPETDFSFVNPDGINLDINSEPTKAITCWDVLTEESNQ